MTKQIRKLRNIEKKYTQMQKDYDKLWGDSSKKDKQIIQLKGRVKLLEDSSQQLAKLKQEKKTVVDKNKKLQKQKQNLQAKN